MAGAIMNKVMDFFGVETNQDEELDNQGYDYENEDIQEEEYEEKKLFGKRNKTRIVPISQELACHKFNKLKWLLNNQQLLKNQKKFVWL